MITLPPTICDEIIRLLSFGIGELPNVPFGRQPLPSNFPSGPSARFEILLDPSMCLNIRVLKPVNVSVRSQKVTVKSSKFSMDLFQPDEYNCHPSLFSKGRSCEFDHSVGWFALGTRNSWEGEYSLKRRSETLWQRVFRGSNDRAPFVP